MRHFYKYFVDVLFRRMFMFQCKGHVVKTKDNFHSNFLITILFFDVVATYKKINLNK